MRCWGFTRETNAVWHKVRKDGGTDGRGVGFDFRNVTGLVLLGVRGGLRTLRSGRTQVNLFSIRKREHSRKPDELYDLIERCSPGPCSELFARFRRPGWHQWGNEDVEENTATGVARRTAHTDRQMRLLESPPAVTPSNRRATGSPCPVRPRTFASAPAPAGAGIIPSHGCQAGGSVPTTGNARWPWSSAAPRSEGGGRLKPSSCWPRVGAASPAARRPTGCPGRSASARRRA